MDTPLAVRLLSNVVLSLTCAAAPLLGQTEGAGQEGEAVSTACQSAEHRQFDFWVGEWDVYGADEVLAGTNRIEPILDGCALRESWIGALGLRGTSINAYDAVVGHWIQTWVDDRGTVLRLEGGMVAGAMVLEGDRPDREGRPVRHRITWTAPSAERVRQHWQVRPEGAAEWRTLFDGEYRRRE